MKLDLEKVKTETLTKVKADVFRIGHTVLDVVEESLDLELTKSAAVIPGEGIQGTSVVTESMYTPPASTSAAVAASGTPSS